LVKDGELVSEGWHYRAGERHAEVHALDEAGTRAQGATAYVTLEPCNHQGRTGPCTQALIKAGITKLVYGMQDPNPLVSGQGLQVLIDAGIDVEGPVLESECRQLNEGFISRMERRRPWVRCKMAMSLDGRTAMASGESQWITGDAARADVQKWRARSDVIITGIGSILQDNSRLTLRREQLSLENKDDVISRPPLRVVLDSQLKIPDDAEVLNDAASTLIVTTESTFKAKPDRYQHLNSTLGERVSAVALPENESGQVSLVEVLVYLVEHYECNDVLLEAGSRLAGAFMQEQLVDELLIYQAPILLGSSARSLFDLPIDLMSDKRQLNIVDRRQLGEDQRIIARI
jgi:diaminohydroxyphosphoribosylaminopyrimidine deaminase/5-amino-6-(5-phosphoribosylamino)uracil reductase